MRHKNPMLGHLNNFAGYFIKFWSLLGHVIVNSGQLSNIKWNPGFGINQRHKRINNFFPVKKIDGNFGNFSAFHIATISFDVDYGIHALKVIRFIYSIKIEGFFGKVLYLFSALQGLSMNRKGILRRILVLVVFGLGTFVSSGQDINSPWAIKVSYSLWQYSGELGNQFLKPEQRNDGAGFSFSRYLSPSFDVLFGLDYYRLKITETQDNSLYKVQGNVFTPALLFSYKFNNGYILKEEARLQPYMAAGFSYLIGNSGGSSIDLQGDHFRHFIDEVAFNYTLGVKYKLGSKVSLFVEFDDQFATTDEIDGASFNRKNDKFRGGRLGIFINLKSVKDSDHDGVLDPDDECPDTPAGVEVDEKGCPKDRDKDGIPDYQDDCPDDPGLPEFNGCPDRDGDGIPDKVDDCPDLPGIPEYNGCPDSDGDGVIDPKDWCPDTQAGLPVDEHGCPIDSDGDGLTDDIDQCPDEPGPTDYMGCPEPPDVGWPDVAQETPPEVYFETDKHELNVESEEELDKIVRFMMESPNMNIRLYGQADPRGTDTHNKELSARRVDSVKKYLMRKGIPESRIMVRALGETQEIQFNDDEKELDLEQRYKKYRRVMFDTFFFMK